MCLATSRPQVVTLDRRVDARAAEGANVEPKAIEPAAMQALIDHRWPGNVRELENVIERALALSTDATVVLSDLPPMGAPSRMAQPLVQGLPFGEAKRKLNEQFEKDSITRALTESGGNVTHAAHALDLSRSVLQRLMKRHGIRPEDYR